MNNVRQNRLSFATDLTAAVREAEAVFIAVGTPSRRGDGHADLTYVYQAAREIAAAIDGFTVIVTKSTVPVGTGDEVERIIREARPDADFAVVSNPEFLREGAAISDFKRPDRILIGLEDTRAEQVMREIYRPLYLNQAPILVTNRRTSELTKYAANAFLATKITFINEIANLCEEVGADVQDVARGIGLDNRIGAKFLHAGPGYGGSCFPKDTQALIKTAQDYGTPIRIVETVAAVNDQRKRAMARKVLAACGGSRARQDHRASRPHLQAEHRRHARIRRRSSIVTALQDAGAKLNVFDPEGMEQARLYLENLTYCGDPYACCEGAAALVIVTEWDAFRALDLERVKSLLAAPVLVDLRNIYDPAEVCAARALPMSASGAAGIEPSRRHDRLSADRSCTIGKTLRARLRGHQHMARCGVRHGFGRQPTTSAETISPVSKLRQDWPARQHGNGIK